MGRKPPPRAKEKKHKRRRMLTGQWSDDALKEAIAAIDAGYKWIEVCNHYGIPRTLLKDYMSGRTRSRKMDLPLILIKEKKEELAQYLQDMVDLGHPLNPSQLKVKVAKMNLARHTPLRHGIPKNSWLKWCSARNAHLVLR